LLSLDAVVMDVDGVLTDGTFLWSDSGAESKRFSFEDVMGLSLARSAGLTLGLISGEDGPLIDRFADKCRIAHVAKGCKDKGAALRDFARSTGIPLERIAYIGDDVNDLPALAIAGLGVAPANAQGPVQAAAALVLAQRGGFGAVREFVNRVLAARAAAASLNSAELR
jgi:3-deoxy-D-manno-octulosonate 8-phosphate phosphatase (KDO 8-P phosphatase)